MKKIVVAVPHSHSWLWTQTCAASLLRNPPKADVFEVEIVIVDNSPWSPAVRGVTETELSKSFTVMPNYKTNQFHASALDCVVESIPFDYLMAWETDVLALRDGWLEWFLAQMRPTDYAVGHWHHESFVNPSCTLYRGDVLRSMREWCLSRSADDADVLRWGNAFESVAPLDNNMLPGDPGIANMRSWVAGPFADKRGWPVGTRLKEQPSGQLKGPGWYEPGQMLHHWAVEAGYSYTICPTATVRLPQNGLPVHTFYGLSNFDSGRQLEFAELAATGAYTVHMWGGTRALDILKHDVTCQFVAGNTGFWLEREARYWRDSVPQDIQRQTIEMIRKYGFHLRGQGTPDVTDRDRAAAEKVKGHYAGGGVAI